MFAECMATRSIFTRQGILSVTYIIHYVAMCYYLIVFMIFYLYYISCTYVKPMNCMVLGNKQYNTAIGTICKLEDGTGVENFL